MLLKCANQWFLVWSQSYTTILLSNFRTFSSPQKETLNPPKVTSDPSPLQQWTITNLLSAFLDLLIVDLQRVVICD